MPTDDPNLHPYEGHYNDGTVNDGFHWSDVKMLLLIAVLIPVALVSWPIRVLQDWRRRRNG